MRAVVALMLVTACSDGPPKRASIECPPGTEHNGTYLRYEFCQLRGTQTHHGPERHYHLDSSVVAQEWTNVQGKREGRYVSRFPSGRTLSSGEYLGGKQHGVWKDWSEHGEVVQEMSYAHGELHGPAIGYVGVTAIEIECYEHGRLVWTKPRWDGIGKVPACPGPPPP